MKPLKIKISIKKSESKIRERDIFYLVGGIGLLGLHTLLKEDFISIVHNYERSQSSPDDWLFFYLLDYILVISGVCLLIVGVCALVIPVFYKRKN